MTLYYLNFQLSNLKPTIPIQFKPVVLVLLLSELIVTPPQRGQIIEVILRVNTCIICYGYTCKMVY